MNIVLGRGNSRRVFVVPSGREMRRMAKEQPLEHTKIRGNLMGLVRQQPVVTMSKKAWAKLVAKNAAKRNNRNV